MSTAAAEPSRNDRRMILGYLVVSSVLIVLGRLGDIYGRVCIYSAFTFGTLSTFLARSPAAA